MAKMIAITTAQPGIRDSVRLMSMTIHCEPPIGALPFGVTTQSGVTPMSPIVRRYGFGGAAGGTGAGGFDTGGGRRGGRAGRGFRRVPVAVRREPPPGLSRLVSLRTSRWRSHDDLPSLATYSLLRGRRLRTHNGGGCGVHPPPFVGGSLIRQRCR